MPIDELIKDHLETLVKPVDADAVMAAVDRRSITRPRRSWLLAAAAAVIVLGIAAAVLANVAGDRPSDVNAGPATSTPTTSTPPNIGVTFATLWTGAAGEPMGRLRSATDQTEFDALWTTALSHTGSFFSAQSVDFDDQVVVSITIPDDACPPTLDRFDVNGSTLTPVFVEPYQQCTKPLAPKTYVVALDWATTGSRFTLRLPANTAYGYDEQLLTIDKPTSQSTADNRMTGRLELTSTSMPTGGTVTGEVIVDNLSGAPVAFTGCDTPFQVNLHGPGIIQSPGWLACAQHMTYPTGESRWPVTIAAKDPSCGSSPGTYGRSCSPATMPNLPTGAYRAVVATQTDEPAIAIPDVVITLTPSN